MIGAVPMPQDVESSLELLGRARNGDRESLERLCARYLPRLKRWAHGRLPPWPRGPLATDDLVQEALLRTLAHIGDFEPRHEAALQAYVRQALMNRIRDEIRRAGRRPAAGELPSQHPDESPSPLEQTIGRQAVERYEAALARLKEEDRAAIVAKLELGGSYQELAESLGKPSADAARMAVSRALVRLAEEMARG
jgi:RNA polymerase sigma-70 factor (ECF subfamily)